MSSSENPVKSSFNNHAHYLNAAQNAVLIKDYGAAEHFFRKAVVVEKNSAVALAGLGQSLCQLNRVHEGIPFLYKAGNLLKIKAKADKNTNFLLDLAYQLIHWHAPEQALILAKAGVAINPNSANANYIAALGLQALNKVSDAHGYAARAVELAPDETNAVILLAVLESRIGRTKDAQQRLEIIVNNVNDPNVARAHKELGIILDKTGDYDLAFEHLCAAGKINLDSPTAQGTDKEAVFRDIRQFKDGFDPQFLKSASHRVLADDLPSPVFLVGFYRSGTTLAEQILTAHAEIVSSEETHLLTHVLNELFNITSPSLTLSARIKSLDSDQIAYLRRYYWTIAERTIGSHVSYKVLVDKTALNTLNIELINTLFPNSVVIFALRDPRDVCLSCFMQSFALSPLTVNLLSWTECARFYALILDYWLSIRDSLSLRWIELRYEDVLNDLEGQFRLVFKKIGLDWSAECNQFYRHSQQKIIKTPSFDQVTRPLYRSSVQRWRNYEKHFLSILPALAPYIKAYGYENH